MRQTNVLLAICLAGCCFGQTVQPPSDLRTLNAVNAEIEQRARRETPVPLTFQVGVGDVLSVRVFQVPDLTGDFVVEHDGTLVLPFLKEALPAKGRTPGQIAVDLRRALQESKLVNEPQVQVSIKEQHSGPVSVIGAVKTPTVFQASHMTTLTAALARAGGLADDAGQVVTIRRSPDRSDTDNGQRQILNIELSRLLSGEDSSLDVLIFGGDTVTVPRAGVIYVLGAVQRAGGFPMKSGEEEITVLKALALAGDLKPTAKPEKASIIRKDSRGAEVTVPVDAARILAGKAPNPPLRASDILFVPDSTTKKAARRVAESAIQILTGVVIWRR
ncbi:MAG: polysaccharide biosynthesis/export family protein [Acidobacteria bacterium]|nr:polysaccharide biosynthesis/export family protein [Acidobacteriota bacterium]